MRWSASSTTMSRSHGRRWRMPRSPGPRASSYCSSPTRRPAARLERNALEAESLGYPPYLGLAAGVQGRDRTDPEALLLVQQPGHRFLIGEPAVAEHDERSLEFVHGLTIDDEHVGHLPHAVDPACQQ